jgi:hypothetical protein
LNENSQSPSNCLFPYLSSFGINPFSEDDLIKLFDAEYMMFLKSKYFKKNALLRFFDKYNVIYLNYVHKDKIIHTLRMINYFIKNADLVDKIKFIEETKIHNLNQIYFSNNETEPNILYKKISFSNQDIFLPFNTYAIKKIEYKLRTFCQIAEKLGAEKIVINYEGQFLKVSKNNLNINANALSDIAQIEVSNNSSNSTDQTINLIFQYPKNNSNITLNKFNIINLIINESEFFIQSEEFDADIDLKFLLDARCINLIQKYNTNFVINCMNEIEKNIMVTAYNYGLHASYYAKTSCNVQININIDFINIYTNPSCIDGSNLYMEKEGYAHLVGIINEEIKVLTNALEAQSNQCILGKQNVYKKINNYLRSYFDYQTKQKTNKKKIQTISVSVKDTHNTNYIQIYTEDTINLMDAYHYIIELNFNDDELKQLFYDYFDNNLNYYNFEVFKNIIVQGIRRKLDKLSFIANQYHIIQKYRFDLINVINNYTNQILNDTKKKLIEANTNNLCLDTSTDTSSEINNEQIILFDSTDITKLINYKQFKNIVADIDFEKLLKNIFYKLLDHQNGLMFTTNIYDITNSLENIISDEKYQINKMKKILLVKFNIQDELFDNFIKAIMNLILNKIIKYDNNSLNITLSQKLQKFYNNYLSDYLDQYYNVYDKMEQLNLKFKNDIPRNEIPPKKMYDNYLRYKLFYTWNDFIKTLNEFIMIDQLPPSINKDLIPISYCRINELMQIEKSEREKFKLLPTSSLNNNIQLYYGPLHLPGLTKLNYINFNNIDPYAEIELIEVQNPNQSNLEEKGNISPSYQRQQPKYYSSIQQPQQYYSPRSQQQQQYYSSISQQYQQTPIQMRSVSRTYGNNYSSNIDTPTQLQNSVQKVQIQFQNNVPISKYNNETISEDNNN